MPLVPVSQRIGYTVEEVARHNTAKSLWVIINRKVYDVTAFHRLHPGGPNVLLQMGGKDATAASATSHKNALPANLMWEFCIGSVVRFKATPEQAPKPPQLTLTKSPQAVPPKPAPVAAQTSLKKAAESKRLAEEVSALADNDCYDSASNAGADNASIEDDRDNDFQGIAGDATSAAAQILTEILRSDSRLARWAKCTDAPQLESQLQAFLTAAGSAWPTIRVRRSVLEANIDHLVDAVLEVFRQPMPLGEDVLAAAVANLGEQSTRDANVTRFFEQIRKGETGLKDVAPGGRNAASSRRGKRRK